MFRDSRSGGIRRPSFGLTELTSVFPGVWSINLGGRVIKAIDYWGFQTPVHGRDVQVKFDVYVSLENLYLLLPHLARSIKEK